MILDLWGMVFHAMVVIAPIFILLLESIWACCDAVSKICIDLHYCFKKPRFYLRMQIFSKYDNRKGTRSYDERKEMYDEGIDVVRPKMLASVWAEKFSAWLSENPEEQ